MRDNNSTTKRPTSSCSYFGNGIVLMRGVNTQVYESGYGATWQYPVYAKKVGFTQEIPLGLAQIQTYP